MIFYKLKKINFLFLFIIILLSFIGFAVLYSAANGEINPWAKKHLIRFLIFLFLLITISLVDIKIWYKYTYYIFFLSLLLLIAVEYTGTFGLGAKRWIKILGVSIQPSELIKVTMILALSKYYHDLKYINIGKLHHLIVPLIIIFTPFIFVVSQPDLGTAIIILILGFSIMFIVGVKIWKFIFGFAIVLLSLPFLWQNIKPYQQQRVLSFLNPESDPLGLGYHLTQSKIALGSGGAIGKGFLQGTQSYLEFLPEKQTDFIFTLIGEEFGFIGTFFILLLFMILILICYFIGIKSQIYFGKILSIGVAINLFLYIVLNTAMVTGLIPVVGVPLPLISYGGTALLSLMISFGFLFNVNVHDHITKIN